MIKFYTFYLDFTVKRLLNKKSTTAIKLNTVASVMNTDFSPVDTTALPELLLDPVLFTTISVVCVEPSS